MKKVENIGMWIEGVDRLGTLYEGIWKIIKRFLSASEHYNVDITISIHSRFENEISDFLKTLPNSVTNRVKVDLFGSSGETYSEGEIKNQAVFANRLAIDCWLLPNPAWSGAQFLDAPIIVWFHDFILADFPESYPEHLGDNFKKSVANLKQKGAMFICLGPYVQQHHAITACNIPPEQTSVIISPPIEVVHLLGENKNNRQACADIVRNDLRENIRKWQSQLQADLFYHHIVNYPFESAPFYFVSSQNRPHKGFQRLAENLTRLVRQEYDSKSIFTTALIDVSGTSSVEQYLKKHFMLGDFLSVGKLSDVAHAAMCSLADIVIHPSTFEGNFPLPFAEAASFYTPCIVPFSAAYKDFIPEEYWNWVFYSPTPDGLTNKIKSIYKNRDVYVKEQQNLLNFLRKNDLSGYFQEHLSVIETAKKLNSSVKASENYSSKSKFLAEVWSNIELERKSQHTDVEVMHWAVYLDKYTVGNWIVLIITNVNTEKTNDIDLCFELGSWIDEDFNIHSRKKLQISDWNILPDDVKSALRILKLDENKSDKNYSYGWAEFTVASIFGTTELRLSGRPIDDTGYGKLKATAVRLEGFAPQE
jgi:glycosyltransferase involved in cell wall biosynthesis